MAKFTVTQRLTLDNQKTSRTFQIDCTDAELTALTALMEGEISVKKEDPQFSQGNADSPVSLSTATVVRSIKIPYKTAAGHYTAEYISTFDKKSMIFKSSASREDIENVLINKGLTGEESTKPTKVDADTTGTYRPVASE
jgi:hypothetical protein